MDHLGLCIAFSWTNVSNSAQIWLNRVFHGSPLTQRLGGCFGACEGLLVLNLEQLIDHLLSKKRIMVMVNSVIQLRISRSKQALFLAYLSGSLLHSLTKMVFK